MQLCSNVGCWLAQPEVITTNQRMADGLSLIARVYVDSSGFKQQAYCFSCKDPSSCFFWLDRGAVRIDLFTFEQFRSARWIYFSQRSCYYDEAVVADTRSRSNCGVQYGPNPVGDANCCVLLWKLILQATSILRLDVKIFNNLFKENSTGTNSGSGRRRIVLVGETSRHSDLASRYPKRNNV